MNLLNSMQINNKKIDKILIGSSIFKWIIDDINIKINYFTNVYKIFKIRIGGGCCASNIFKSELKKNNSKLDIKFPEKKYCGDNAAMIANLCYLTFKKN
jgi:tRNA A37 threonylcarbamoyltransferase TsaD